MASTSDLLDSYRGMLLEKIREAEFPSKPMMNRYESLLDDIDDARAYIEVLFEKVGGEHPSVEMLDRIERMLALVELSERAQELAEQQD